MNLVAFIKLLLKVKALFKKDKPVAPDKKVKR
jgi:hypothetical protein